MTSDSKNDLSKSSVEPGSESPITDIPLEKLPLKQPPPDPSRARIGTGGMYVKVLISLILVGLLPALGSIYLVTKPGSSLDSSVEQFDKDFDKLFSYLDTLQKQLQASNKKASQLEQAVALQRFLTHREKRISSLATKLQSVMTNLTEDQIPDDKTVINTIKNAPFDKVVLIQKSTNTVLLTKTGKRQGKIDTVFPGLAASIKKSTTGTKDETGISPWVFVDLGSSSYVVAAETKPPVFSRNSFNPLPAAPGVSLSAIKQSTNELHTTIELLWWALPLFAVCLVLVVIAWFSKTLLKPLSFLTSSATRILERPGELDQTLLERSSGLAQDLGTSLFRLDQRSVRLAELDKKFEDMRKELASMSSALKSASADMPKARLSTEIVDFQELAQSINDLLESMAGKLASVHRATALVHEASARLDPVIRRLSQSMVTNNPELLPDVSHMGKFLGVYINDLCSVADNIQRLIENEAPEQLDQEELKEYKVSIQGTQNGMQLLNDAIEGILSLTQKTVSLRQDVEILYTNISIISDNNSIEGKTHHHLQRMVLDTEKLSANLSGLCRQMTQSLENIAATGKKLNEVFLKTTTHFKKTAKQLIGWSSLHVKLTRTSKELGDKVEVVRPNAALLGEDLQKLSTDCILSLADRKELAKLTTKATELNTTIVGTSQQLLLQMEKLNTDGTQPDITAELANQQIKLRQVLNELNTLADSGGVDALSDETRLILDEVTSMAQSAREKVMKTAPSSEASGKNPAEQYDEPLEDNNNPHGEKQGMDFE